MSLLPALRPFTPSARSVAPQSIVLTVAPDVAQGKASPLRGESLKALSFPLTLTVQSSTPQSNPSGGVPSFTLTLTLPDGRTVEAQSPTPLPAGTPLTLATLPPETDAAAPLLLRALPNAVPQPQLQPALPPTAPTPQAATPVVAQTAVPVLTLTSATPTPPPVVVYPANTAVPGPIQFQVQTPLPPEWQGQPLSLTLRTPTQGVLTTPLPTAATPAGAPRPTTEVAIKLSAILNLPLKQVIPISNGQNIPLSQNINTFNASILPIQQDIVSNPPSPTLPLTALRVLLPTPSPESPPLLGTFTARVLPPLPNTPLQPLLLSNGTIAQLELPTPAETRITNPLPQALPAGSVVLVNIATLNGPAAILQLHTNQPQLLPQTTTANPVTAPQTPQAVLAIGSTLSGTIVGQNAEGQPLIRLVIPAAVPTPNSAPNTPQTPAPQTQTFALTLQPNTAGNTPQQAPLAASLVVGARVQLQIGADGTATLLNVTLPQAAAKATAVANFSTQWAALAGALGALQSHSPSLAAQAKRNIPQLANLLPGLMRLLDSLPEADSAKLLGTEAARVAQALGHSLGADLSQLATLTQRPEEGGWRGVLFPYQENPDGQPKQGGFFWRREERDDPRGQSSARFVAELELSSLGALQLDGLLTYPSLWLKLRSHTALSPEDADGLTALVNSLLEQFNLEGGISLETTATFPLNPGQEIRARAEDALSLPT